MNKPRSLSRRMFLGLSHLLNDRLEFRRLRRWWRAVTPPEVLTIERVPVTLPRLPRSFQGYTIAQFSDLHAGAYVSRAELRAVVEATLQLRPDLIVITGDFVSRLSRGELPLLTEELTRLSAPDGVLAVLGNHDWWTDAEAVTEAVSRAGVQVLRNARVTVWRGDEVLHIAGVDDVQERKADLKLALRGVPATGAAVLLAHEPDYADIVAQDQRVVLQLSGHAHGGQVRFPVVGALVRTRMGRKYVMGLYRIGGLTLYTNRGIGTVSPGIRWNCPPEITLLTLR